MRASLRFIVDILKLQVHPVVVRGSVVVGSRLAVRTGLKDIRGSFCCCYCSWVHSFSPVGLEIQLITYSGKFKL